MSINRLSCCGIEEFRGLYGYKTPKDILLSLTNLSAAYLIFVDQEYTNKVQGVADFIEKERLGEVIRIPPRRNPNSGNRLYMVVWCIRPHVFKRWHAENRVAAIAEDTADVI